MIITTAEQLQTLPEGSVILDSVRPPSSWTLVRDSPRITFPGEEYVWSSVDWVMDRFSHELAEDNLFGPFYVLYRPDRPSLQSMLKDLVEISEKSDAQHGSAQRPYTDWAMGIRYAVNKIRGTFE